MFHLILPSRISRFVRRTLNFIGLNLVLDCFKLPIDKCYLKAISIKIFFLLTLRNNRFTFLFTFFTIPNKYLTC